jgi:hypothetical protein
MREIALREYRGMPAYVSVEVKVHAFLTILPLYSRGERPPLLLGRRLGVPHIRSGHSDDEKISYPNLYFVTKLVREILA